MSKPLAAIPAEAFIYRAIARMSRLKIRHLGVVDDAGIRGRRVVGARPVAPAGRRGGAAGRRDRAGAGRARAWHRLGETAACRGLAGRRRRGRARYRRRHLARAWRADAAGRDHRRGAHAGGGAGRAALRLRACRARLRRARGMPARHGPGQCAGVRARRAGRIAGSLVRDARHPCRRYPARGRRALLQGRGHGQEPAMARLGRDLAASASRTGSAARGRKTCWRSTFSSICAACTAGSRLPMRCGARASRPPGARPRSPSCSPRRPARSSRVSDFSAA